MATVPSQATKAINDKVSASLWNDDVRDAVNFFTTNRPVFFATQATAQVGWTSATFTSITFTTEVLDRDGQHSTSTNTSRVTIGNTLGYYRVVGNYTAAQNAAATVLRATIALNGAIVDGSTGSWQNPGGGSTYSVWTNPVIVQASNAADYVEIQGWMTAASGTIGTAAAASFRSSLLVEWIGS